MLLARPVKGIGRLAGHYESTVFHFGEDVAIKLPANLPQQFFRVSIHKWSPGGMRNDAAIRASGLADVFFHNRSRFRAQFISYVGHLISMRQLMSTRMVYSYPGTDEIQVHKL